jgi:hypothetical protein
MFKDLPKKMREHILKAALKAYRAQGKRTEKEVVTDVCEAAFKAIMK